MGPLVGGNQFHHQLTDFGRVIAGRIFKEVRALGTKLIEIKEGPFPETDEKDKVDLA